MQDAGCRSGSQWRRGKMVGAMATANGRLGWGGAAASGLLAFARVHGLRVRGKVGTTRHPPHSGVKRPFSASRSWIRII